MKFGATQISLLGFTAYTVDAIGWTAIYPWYAYRPGAEGLIENTGAVTVNLRTDPTDGAHERPLLSGEALQFNIDPSPRGTLLPPEAPICYAKAASGTCTLIVTER